MTHGAGQLDQVWLSTVETLAMAVDATDRLTLRHTRRVQAYAERLAARVGMTGERELMALGAAAILHDIGKLAIPDVILNKPGGLTAAEFDEMKLHAGIGADWLSALRLPQAVVAMVRHHHEHWDGSGYPGGLAGTNIPTGARILAIADCFDALTSDRPYRPRLSPEDALLILRQRSGLMYDPVMVESFVHLYQDVAADGDWVQGVTV